MVLLVILKTQKTSEAKRIRQWSRIIQVDKSRIQAHRLSPLGLHVFIPLTKPPSKPFMWNVGESTDNAELAKFETELKAQGVSQIECGLNANWVSLFMPGAGIPEDKMNKAARILIQLKEKLQL